MHLAGLSGMAASSLSHFYLLKGLACDVSSCTWGEEPLVLLQMSVHLAYCFLLCR